MEKKNAPLYKVTLGNPKIDCRRYGICRIDDSDFTMIPTALPENTAWATIETTEQTWVFKFLRDTMTDATFKKHFSSGFFRVESAVCWESKNIPVGIYPIHLLGKEMTVKTYPPSVFISFGGLQALSIWN